MGNSVVVADIICKEALVLLKNNLVFAPLVFRGYESEIGNGHGDTITIKKPFRTKTASGRVLVKQPLVDQTLTFKPQFREHFACSVSDEDLTLTLNQYSERYLKSGIIGIANVIDKSIADTIKVGSFFTYGTPGTAPTIDTFHDASAVMDDLAIPNDGMRVVVLNSADGSNVSKAVYGKYNEDMVKTAITKGYLGPIADFSLYKSTNTSPMTVGLQGGTPLINGASQTGTSLISDGWTGSVKVLNAGDVIALAGVYEINPQNYGSTGRQQGFVVTSDVYSDSSGNAVIPILPAINNGTLSTTDTEGNTVSLAAYQNVSAAPADNAAITISGTSGGIYRQNLFFHKHACAFAMVPIDIPKSFVVKSRVTDPLSGLSLGMCSAADINNMDETTRIDAKWGVKMIYPELALRNYSSKLN